MNKKTMLTLLLLEFLIVFEMSMVMPLAPLIAKTYHIPESYVTWINIGYTLAGFIAPLFGRWADRKSMKKTMIVVLGSFILGCLGLSFSSSVVLYFIFRFFIGIGYFTLLSLIVSYASLTIDPAKYQSFSGAIKVAFASGVLVAPLLCAWLEQHFSYQSIYMLLGSVGAVCFMMLCFIDEVKAGTTSSSIKLFSLLKDKTVLRMIVACFIVSMPGVYVFSLTSVYLSGQGYDQNYISLLYTVMASGSLLAGVLLMFLGHRIRLWMGLLVGTMITMVMIPFYTLSGAILFFVGFIFAFGYDLLWGCFYPYSATLKPKVSGSFLTLLSLSMAFSNLVNYFIGPFIYNSFGYQLGLWLTSVAYIVACLLIWRNKEQKNLITDC